jgi:peptidyl-prolyl cis-trans isomerase SurA
MHKFNYLLIIAWILQIQPAVAQGELSSTGVPLDGVVAVVNEGIVTRSALARQVESITKRAREQEMQLPPADVFEEQVLERLIVEEVQMQRAERVGIVISDQMLNTAITRVADEAGVNHTPLFESQVTFW